ncbi:hypothetical protein RB623_23785 [Mesorhizobium sp. LHD-90]|uniref:hypothetical protein n=1 Tax=Mesorhizobium sp. LHD-90 TaxID=3071414 RepID=UPI0027E0A7E5|nr:hypothetical protein [Mesorhizobium sp. LHD-90]MDQ6437085.1 hypothetical protein [Mesorhizobium sp. LHD-90]
MSAWLQQNFIRVGIIALVVDLSSRFYFQVGMSWLTEKAIESGWTFDQTTKLAHVSTALDLTATLLWGLFTLGFAIRVLSELRRR